MNRPLRQLMTGCFLLTFAFASAQPTLTATGMNYTIGESFTFKGGAYVSPGNAGPAQTWNLNFSNATSGGLNIVVNPNTTTNGSAFPNANVALSNPTTGTVVYYKTTGSALHNYGSFGGGAVMPYSDAEDLLRFPMTYSSTYDDNWAATFSSAGLDYERTGTTTVTSDGYGTLITPDGTFTNVMRIHFEQYYQDSTDLGGGTPFIISYYNDQYMWYKDGIHSPIASVYNLESDISAPRTGGYYLSGASSSLTRITQNPNLVQVSPNPATDQITFNIGLNDNKPMEIIIYNALGMKSEIQQSFSGMTGSNILEMDIAGLQSGIYFAQIICEGNIYATQRFVVVR